MVEKLDSEFPRIMLDTECKDLNDDLQKIHGIKTNMTPEEVDDFIFLKQGAVSKENCNRAIELFEEEKKYNDGTIGPERTIDAKQKICKEIYIEEGYPNPYNDLFIGDLNAALEDYKKKYPYINFVNPWKFERWYKLQRYKPNEGYFGLHCENNGSCLTRMLVWMVYLNDVTDEGFTIFPTQRKLFQPRTGDILIWPAFWTHPHKGITSKTQSKYILTGWWDFKLMLNSTDYTNG